MGIVLVSGTLNPKPGIFLITLFLSKLKRDALHIEPVHHTNISIHDMRHTMSQFTKYEGQQALTLQMNSLTQCAEINQ